MSRSEPKQLTRDAPLAPLTTLGVGGAAQHLVLAEDAATVLDALGWARSRGLPTVVLGGGSNVIVPDAGVPGLVLAVRSRGVGVQLRGDSAYVTAAAGEPWDALVARCVEEDLAGIECLSGIPGLVGATPIQNVGAYGQEVSSSVVSVRAIDRHSLEEVVLSARECQFSYRDSALKREPDRYVVLDVTFLLRKRGAPTLQYKELLDALQVRRSENPASAASAPRLREVRALVLELRKRKSMVHDPSAPDENLRSVGSFFLNPVVPRAQADTLAAQLVQGGALASADALPCFATTQEDHVKLAAAFLIEAAGFQKGERRGAVGISTKHSLALVCHEGATATDLLSFASEIEARVHERLGVQLEREPVVLRV